MDFNKHRDTIDHIKKIARRHTSLTRADLAELHKLNEKCLSFEKNLSGAFSVLANEIESGIILLLEQLEGIKKQWSTASDPSGNLDDLFLLESSWSKACILRDRIQSAIKPLDNNVLTPGPSMKPAQLNNQSTSLLRRNEFDAFREEVAVTAESYALTENSSSRTTPKITMTKHQRPVSTKDFNITLPQKNITAFHWKTNDLGETGEGIMKEIINYVEAIKGNQENKVFLTSIKNRS